MVNEKLIQLLNTKGVLNFDTTDATFIVFNAIKKLLGQFPSKVKSEGCIDSRIKILFNDRGMFEAELKLADDVIVFILHTNAFVFESGNPLMKTSYVENNSANATCGMISIYNFQSDSFKYDRKNDIGVLIARMFVNKEAHFFVEGKKQLGVLFNDYSKMIASPENLSLLIESCIVHCLEVDVVIPPVVAMKQIYLYEAQSYNLQSSLAANNRLGFKFQKESDDVTDI